jgi:hypothetical protein
LHAAHPDAFRHEAPAVEARIMRGIRPMRLLSAFTFGVVLALATDARGDGDPPKERRDRSYFRGRDEPNPHADLGAQIARAVLYPIRLLVDSLLRIPVDGGARFIERHHVIPIARNIFHPTPNFTWYPTLTIDLGVYGAVGARAHWDHALVRNHEVDAAIATGGIDAWQGHLRDDFRFGHSRVGVQAKFFSRRDRDFYGLGPSSSSDDHTHFALTIGEVAAFASFEDKHAILQLSQGYSDELTGPGYDPSIETHFDPATIPGYGQEIGLANAAIDVKLDSRGTVHDEQSGGVAFIGNATYSRDVRDMQRTFLSTTADVQVAIEVMRPGRVLTLRAYGQDTFALGSEPVPFTHQAMLGWTHHYGFYWGRFRGEAAVMAEAHYRYPIAYLLDMMWIASAGNVFQHDFSDFSLGALTGSLGVGVRTRRTGSPPIEIIFALGTKRFEEPFAFEGARLYITTSGDLL